MLLCTFGLKDLEKHERPEKKGPKTGCSGYVSGIIPSSYVEMIISHYKDAF